MTKNQMFLLTGAIAMLCLCLAAGGVGAYVWWGDQGDNVALGASQATLPPAPATPTEAPATTATTSPVEPISTDPPPVESAAKLTAGNTFEQAAVITPGQYTDSLIEGEEDWYQFEVSPGGIIALTFTAGSDLAEGYNRAQSVTIFNPDREEVVWETKVERGKIAPLRWVTNASQGGMYYLRVADGRLYVDYEPNFDGTGSYSFDLVLQQQNDAASGGDAADEFGQAQAIQAGQPITGQLGGSDEEDWYKIEVSGGQILDLTFTPGQDVPETQSIFAFDADYGDPLWEAQHVFPSVQQPGQWVLDTTKAGVYYFLITPGYLKDGTGSYTLEVSLQPQNDANSGSDAAGEPGLALDLAPGQSITGQVGNFDELDCYKFTPTSGQTVSYTPDAEAKGGAVVLGNADRQEIWREDPVAPAVTKSYQLDEVASGPYYLCLAGVGSYTVEVR